MSELDNFRKEVKEWLDSNCPKSMRAGADPDTPIYEVWGGRKAVYKNPDSKIWLDRMGEKGWTMPTVPSEYGGGGLNKEEVKILNEELFAIGARSPLLSFGRWMLAPVLLEYGSEEQKKEHLPKIIKGEIRWCQGYSEPGSGSDLASLATKAEDIGEHFMVNGQKVWTSYADKADWIFALVRTGPKEPKHDGISFLLIDMETKGVSTKPITLISGKSPFCETFFDDVKVPKSNLVGQLNAGWAIAKALLQHERAFISNFGLASGMGSKKDIISDRFWTIKGLNFLDDMCVFTFGFLILTLKHHKTYVSFFLIMIVLSHQALFLVQMEMFLRGCSFVLQMKNVIR